MDKIIEYNIVDFKKVKNTKEFYEQLEIYQDLISHKIKYNEIHISASSYDKLRKYIFKNNKSDSMIASIHFKCCQDLLTHSPVIHYEDFPKNEILIKNN